MTEREIHLASNPPNSPIQNVIEYKLLQAFDYDTLSPQELKEQVKKTIALYNRMIYHLRGCACRLDAEYRIVFMNKGMISLFGYSEEERNCIAGLSIFDLMTDSGKTMEVAKRIRDNTAIMSPMPGEFKAKDGSQIYALVTTAPLSKDTVGYDGTIVTLFDITERKKAEEALKKSQEDYKHLLEYAPTAIYEIDCKTSRYLSVNDAMSKLSGYTKEELLSLNPFDLMEPESVELFKDRLRRGLSGEKISESAEYRVVTKDGRHLCAVIHVKPEYKDGKLDRALVVAYDITERKKAEEALKSYTVVQNGANMILDAALKSTHEELGEVCLRVAEAVTQSKFGFIGEITPSGLQDIALGDPGWEACEVITEQGHSRSPGNFKIHGIYGRVLLDGQGFYTNDPSSHPDKIVLPKGHPPLQNFLGVPLNREGKNIGVIAVANRAGGFRDEDLAALEALAPIIVDAFARKRTEEALREKKEELERHIENLKKLIEARALELENSADYARNLIEVSLDLLVTINAEGKITDVNKATEKATGCCRKTLIGSSFSDYFTDPEKAEEGYKKVLAQGYVKDYPLAIRSQSGEVMEVLYNATIYFDKAGKPQGVFAAARDITDRRRAESQALESARKLKEAERLAAIGATAGMVGHDIRNPLQAITGELYLLKTGLASMPKGNTKVEVSESLEGIEKNVEYINKIVADLQDYARVITPVAQEVFLGSLCEEVLFRGYIPENINVACTVEDDVRVIVSDKDLLKRVLTNLVSNAVQAMPEGGALLVHGFMEQGNLTLTVEDTGVGIPEEVKSKLFTPMFTTKSKGQGFGLAVIKRVTEALGGSVDFESVVGKGTKFIIRLPCKEIKR